MELDQWLVALMDAVNNGGQVPPKPAGVNVVATSELVRSSTDPENAGFIRMNCTFRILSIKERLEKWQQAANQASEKGEMIPSLPEGFFIYHDTVTQESMTDQIGGVKMSMRIGYDGRKQ